MIEKKDIFACWWWYNWYIAHTSATFETEPVQAADFEARVNRVRERYPWIVLQEDEDLRGYAYLDTFNARAAYDWTADISIYIAPDQKGLGYGRQLMEALISLARQDGYRNLVSLVTEGNDASVHLHEKFGFTKAGFYPGFGFKNGKWLGVSIYALALADGEDEMPHPQNLNPYAAVRPNRVPVDL